MASRYSNRLRSITIPFPDLTLLVISVQKILDREIGKLISMNLSRVLHSTAVAIVEIPTFLCKKTLLSTIWNVRVAQMANHLALLGLPAHIDRNTISRTSPLHANISAGPPSLSTPLLLSRHVRLAPLPELSQNTCQLAFFEPEVSFHGFNHVGSVLDSQTPDAVECCRRCATAAACTHWTWMEGGKCQLKRGDLVPGPGLPGTVSGSATPGERADRLAAPLDPETAALLSDHELHLGSPPTAEGSPAFLDPVLLLSQPDLMRSFGMDPALFPHSDLLPKQGDPRWLSRPSSFPNPGSQQQPHCEWETEDATALKAGLFRCETREAPHIYDSCTKDTTKIILN